MTPEQIEYVKGELAKGFSSESIKERLRSSGYTEDLIGQLFAAVDSGVPAPGQPMIAQKTGPSVLKIVLIILGVLIIVPIVFSLIMGVFVMGSLNDARDKAEDASAKATLNNVRGYAEMYYDGNDFSYAGFCMSENARTIENTLSSFQCTDSADAYSASASLEGGTYYCADSTGAFVDMPTRPLGTSCQ